MEGTIWNQVAQFLGEIAGTALITLCCWAIKELITFLKQKVKDGRIKSALDEVERVVIDGVYYMEQTMVSYYKKTGNWDAETQQKVCLQCRDYVLKTLTEETKLILQEDNQQAVEELVVSKIQSYLGKIHEVKK